MSSRVKVVVTGAAGQIAYSLIPRLVDGKTFGNRIVDLCLVEIPQVVSKLEGLVMELEDSYFPHMGEVTYTDFETYEADGAGNKVSADLDATTARLSIGYKF